MQTSPTHNTQAFPNLFDTALKIQAERRSEALRLAEEQRQEDEYFAGLMTRLCGRA